MNFDSRGVGVLALKPPQSFEKIKVITLGRNRHPTYRYILLDRKVLDGARCHLSIVMRGIGNDFQPPVQGSS
jgi:hypothetical protein